jgi:hypothetical protein
VADVPSELCLTPPQETKKKGYDNFYSVHAQFRILKTQSNLIGFMNNNNNNKNQLTPGCRVLLGKPIVAQPQKKFSGFYRTRRIITVFTKVCNWNVS